MRFRRASAAPAPSAPAAAAGGQVTIRIQDARGNGVSTVLTEHEMRGAEARWLLEGKACALASTFWERSHR